MPLPSVRCARSELAAAASMPAPTRGGRMPVAALLERTASAVWPLLAVAEESSPPIAGAPCGGAGEDGRLRPPAAGAAASEASRP
jgi:hypothetical protein